MLSWQNAPRSRPLRVLKCKIWGEMPTGGAFGHKNWHLCRCSELGLCLGEMHDTEYCLFLPLVSVKPHQAANELLEGETRVSNTSVLTLRGTFTSDILNFINTHTFVFHYMFTRTTLTKSGPIRCIWHKYAQTASQWPNTRERMQRDAKMEIKHLVTDGPNQRSGLPIQSQNFYMFSASYDREKLHTKCRLPVSYFLSIYGDRTEVILSAKLKNG